LIKCDEPEWIQATMDADDELEQHIGSVVKRDPATGIIDWDQFLKIIEISTKYAKITSAKKHREMIYFRRLARSKKDDAKYEEIVSNMIKWEQMRFESRLDEIK
jgi:hypothetical protein